MNMRSQTTLFATILSLIFSPIGAIASDVLQNVPNDALGFVVLKNLSATDGKVDKLLQSLNVGYPSPLAFLKVVTGIDEGIDPQGDLLLIVLPSTGGRNDAPEFCVWLPVVDYDKMLTSLGTTPVKGIAAIQVADEDLLVARRGDWAVIIDPDQRERLARMLNESPSPPAGINNLKSWIDETAIAAVVLQSGIKEIIGWAEKMPSGQSRRSGQEEDDLFGDTEPGAAEDSFAAGSDSRGRSHPLYDPIRRKINDWIIRSPDLRKLLEGAGALGCAVQLDDGGTATASLRLTHAETGLFEASDDRGTLPPALYQSGDFVLHGAGTFPQQLQKIISATYARKTVDDLKISERIAIRKSDSDRFEQAFETAASGITSWLVVNLPGDQQSGLYNNKYVVLHTDSSKAFVERAEDVMSTWNKMHRDANGASNFVFDIEESRVGERDAIQYLLDVTAGENLQAIPEIRQAMEKLFGPGGKLRLWLVTVDDKNVLLGTGVSDQIAAALKSLDRKQVVDWNQPKLVPTNAMLPDNADWRIFLSPGGHFEWHQRLSDAMNGPVLGAPASKKFAASPPIGMTGQVRDGELGIEIVLPAETIKAAGTYFTK